MGSVVVMGLYLNPFTLNCVFCRLLLNLNLVYYNLFLSKISWQYTKFLLTVSDIGKYQNFFLYSVCCLLLQKITNFGEYLIFFCTVQYELNKCITRELIFFVYSM